MREMGSGRIPSLILKYAWPTVVTMTINQLYNVVDRIYIGRGLGPDALAGITLTAPIMMALGAVGVMIGMGSSTIMSIRLGAGDRPGAEKALGSCIALKIIFGLTVPPLMYLFAFRPVIEFMAGRGGATPEAVRLAILYLSITIFFNIFAHLGFGLSAMMRAEGSPKRSMICMLAGCLTNIVLDPLFIFDRITIPHTDITLPVRGLGMGVAGAAWATNIAMVVTCSTALAFYISRSSVVRLRWRRIRPWSGITGRSLAIGLSPCIMQMMGAIIGLSFNRAFATWSPTPERGTIEISAFGITNAITFLFFIPCMGVQQGVAPIIGFNWGAKDYRRVLKCLTTGLKLTALTTFGVFLGTELAPRFLARAFASDAGVVDAAVRGLRVMNVLTWTIFVNVAATTYFQAVGKPRTAIMLSLLRQCICILPVVWFLPHVMPNPLFAVWLSFPISDIVAQIATLPPLLRDIRFLKAQS